MSETISFSRLKEYLKFFGPAWLVMIADMDASSTIGAAETGALFKYGLIWFMFLLIIPLYLVQETSGRIGTVTRKGLGEIIRENYTRNTTLLMTIPMAITDMVTYAVEYIGIAIGLDLLGIPGIVALPFVYVVNILIVTRKKGMMIEKILLAITLVLIASFVAVLFIRGIMPYSPVYFSPRPSFLFILAVNVGAVIMPFMLFFQTSATAEKVSKVRLAGNSGAPADSTLEHSELKFTRSALRSMRTETLVGAVISELLMVIVEMTMSGVSADTNFASARQLSTALSVVANSYSPYLFGIGLIGSAFLALVVISLGSAWGLGEALGFGRNGKNLIYIFESLPSLAAAMIIPQSMLISSTLYILVFFVFVLAGPATITGLIARNKRIMGEYRSSRPREIAFWTSIGVVIFFGILAIA
ncbi:MAG: divalent metal cation transporter [Thermoplasmataceae archaeon]